MKINDNRKAGSLPFLSILIITYNPDWIKLKATLDSVLHQNNKDYELVFTDDGSKEASIYKKLKLYLEHREFSNYITIENPANQGTVRNILSGASFCKGRYIKVIGPGDLLYSSDTLQNIKDFAASSGSRLIAGYPVGYTLTVDGRRKKVSFHHPFDISAYRNNNESRILKNLILYTDTVCGANLCYERDFLIDYLSILKGRVIYAEDLVQILSAIHGERTHFMDSCMVLYEVDSGSSTLKDSPFKKLLKKDVEEFYKLLSEQFPDDKLIQKRIILSKYYSIDNLYLRTFLRSFANPGLYIYMLRHYLDILTGKYKPKERNDTRQ